MWVFCRLKWFWGGVFVGAGPCGSDSGTSEVGSEGHLGVGGCSRVDGRWVVCVVVRHAWARIVHFAMSFGLSIL